ncbi:hypothetical protein MRB53_002662 [Persea americana]|uniref:Uncharacterized protein n=1 Tax=Persea americana TaxID=3435 RepID=A0ACC2MVB3_PERAE|nr:hypothetical protein MRB53_002662 [Persea americana]
MQFQLGTALIQLKGVTSVFGTVKGTGEFNRLFFQQRQGIFVYLLQSTTRPDSPLHPSISSLLEQFADIFAEPRGLPPSRSHDHRIPLIPSSTPTNVRQYRYPHFQKNQIKRLVREMCDSGAVLMQNGHPLAYLMQNGHPLAYLSGRNLTLSIYDKEMLAIIFAVSKWRPYLSGTHFKFLTDHRTLKYFVEQRLTTMEQPKWLTKLIGYDYEIIYRSGKENTVADAISRLGEYAALFMVSQTIFSFIPDIIATYSQDPNLGSIRDRLRVDPLGVPHYSLDNDMLRYKGRIVVPTNSEWCSKKFSDFHASPFGVSRVNTTSLNSSCYEQSYMKHLKVS